jgi:hypothetical protein
VAVVCALLLVASLGVLTYAVDRLRDTDPQDAQAQQAVESAAEAADRQAALEAARSFFTAANNFSVEDLPEYNERVSPLLTSGFAKQFKDATRKILGQLKETKLTARGRYVAGAVETIDADSAAVLVAGNARSTSTLVRRVYYPRWRVSLVKEGESWLVNNYTELGDAGLAFQP